MPYSEEEKVRKAVNGLPAIVQKNMQQNPFSGLFERYPLADSSDDWKKLLPWDIFRV